MSPALRSGASRSRTVDSVRCHVASQQGACGPTRPAAPWRAVAWVVAVVVAAHGIAHLAGITDAWRRARGGGGVDDVTGAWEVSNPSVLRALAMVWALAAVAFVVSAVAIGSRSARWGGLLLGATLSRCRRPCSG